MILWSAVVKSSYKEQRVMEASRVSLQIFAVDILQAADRHLFEMLQLSCFVRFTLQYHQRED